MAKLYYRYGAMNSGKTTALLQVAHNYEERGMNVVIIKAKVDKKGNNSIVSRLGIDRKVDIWADESVDIFQQVIKNDRKVSCVLVDEAQFLKEEQVMMLFNLTIMENIPVIAYGIRTDFQGDLFPGSRKLFALAHTIEELKTICRCGRKAIMNGRKINGEFVFAGTQIAIDGANRVTYESLCGNCYMAEKQKSK